MGVKSGRFIVIVGFFLLVFGLSLIAKTAWSDPSMHPSSGSILISSTVTFTWGNIPDADRWRLSVGTSPERSNIYDSGTRDNSNPRTVYYIPTDGSTIHVMIRWRINHRLDMGLTSWHKANYTYTAARGDEVGGTDSSGADFSASVSKPLLTVQYTPITSVSITAPSHGVVIVNTSGYYWFASSGIDGAYCMIADSSGKDNLAYSHTMYGREKIDSTFETPFSGTRAFNANGAGTRTYRLICKNNTSGEVTIENAVMTAIFVPNKY